MIDWKRNVYVIWFIQILSLMGFSFGLPFIPYYIQELEVLTDVQVKTYTALMNSLPAISLGIMGPIWGVLADKYGKKVMLIRATGVGVLVMIGFAVSQAAWQVLVFRTLQGVFTGTVTAATALVASYTPNQKLSSTLGFLSSSTFIGFSLGPLLGGIASETVGYRNSFYIGAVLLFIAAVLVVLFVKENRGIIDEDTKEVDKKNRVSMILKIKTILTPLLIMMFTMYFLLRISRSIFAPYLSLYVQYIRGTIEGSARVTGLIGGLVGFVTAISGIVIGKLGEKYEKRILMMICVFGGIVFAFLTYNTNDLKTFSIFYAGIFLFLGGVEPLIMSVSSALVKNNQRGLLFGVQTLVGSLAWAISPAAGAMISIKYSYNTVILMIPITLSFALIFLIINHVIIRRREL